MLGVIVHRKGDIIGEVVVGDRTDVLHHRTQLLALNGLEFDVFPHVVFPLIVDGLDLIHEPGCFHWLL